MVQKEIDKPLVKGIIKKSQHEEGEITKIKKKISENKIRLILNLKANEHIDDMHFKMETRSTILKLIRPNCYTASVDIKDAYCSVPIAEEDQKHLKFVFEGQLYQFCCLPNGLCSGPSKFTKVLKPPLATLRGLGHILDACINDIFNMGKTFEECLNNVIESVTLSTKLGSNIHPDK